MWDVIQRRLLVKLPSFLDNLLAPPSGFKQYKALLEKFAKHRLIFR
jgi:hypothetical protein